MEMICTVVVFGHPPATLLPTNVAFKVVYPLWKGDWHNRTYELLFQHSCGLIA